MKKFILLYKGPATPPGASHKQWPPWFKKVGDNLVDTGSSMKNGVVLRGDGSTSDSATDLNGYSIIDSAPLECWWANSPRRHKVHRDFFVDFSVFSVSLCLDSASRFITNTLQGDYPVLPAWINIPKYNTHSPWVGFNDNQSLLRRFI